MDSQFYPGPHGGCTTSHPHAHPVSQSGPTPDDMMENAETLPCGCRIGTVEDTFVIEACPAGESCQWVQYVLAESERQGKPSTILQVP